MEISPTVSLEKKLEVTSKRDFDKGTSALFLFVRLYKYDLIIEIADVLSTRDRLNYQIINICMGR